MKSTPAVIIGQFRREKENLQMISQGAEARLYEIEHGDTVYIVKERFAKSYRVKELDDMLRRKHTQAEVKALQKCAKFTIPAPVHFESQPKEGLLVIGRIVGETLKVALDETKIGADECGRRMGNIVGQIHARGICHGDLTTSNFMIDSSDKAFVIDFGLAMMSDTDENRAVDLHVLEKALNSAHPDKIIFDAFLAEYKRVLGDLLPEKKKGEVTRILDKLENVRQRGRKRSMVG